MNLKSYFSFFFSIAAGTTWLSRMQDHFIIAHRAQIAFTK